MIAYWRSRVTRQAATPIRFACQLRALGQALEKFCLSAFDLEIRSGTYLVVGKETPAGHVNFSFSRFDREFIRRSSRRGSLTSTDRQVDLRFSTEDNECFELRGKSRRQDPSKMPDPCTARRWMLFGQRNSQNQ
jgi:hypothetical protein